MPYLWSFSARRPSDILRGFRITGNRSTFSSRMDDITDLLNKPKTVPPLVKRRNDTVNQSQDESSNITTADYQRAGPSSPQGISSEPYRGTSLTRVDISEQIMRDGGENEQNPMIRYPPRQFAATPDSERSSGDVIMDDLVGEKLIFAREGVARNDVPEIIVESMTLTTEYQKEGEIEDESQSEQIMRDGGENEQSPMIRYPPRQFAATPDSERSSGVAIMDDLAREKLIFAREGAARNDVPEIIVESMSSTTEYQKEGEIEDESQRLPFGNMGKAVERVELKPRPASPILGKGRPAQIPLMGYGVGARVGARVGAAVEKNKLDGALGPDPSIYEHPTPKYSSPFTPHDNHASKMSPVAEIMQTDPYGNKLERTPSTAGRYQPIGSNEFSLLRPCEMDLYTKSRNRVDMQRSASHLEKVTNTEHAAEKDTVHVTKETDHVDKKMASNVLGKLLGKLGSDSGPATSADKKPATADGADSNQSGLASTAGILASVIRWKTKKKLNTGTRESREKYPGYLDLFNRLSHELMTSVPFPILLQTRREALPIIQNIAKAYKSTLGPHHQMTEQACAKVEKLRSELQDNDVFL